MSRYGWMLGLAAMATVTPGGAGCAGTADGVSGLVAPTTAPAAGVPLEETAQWKHLQATWGEASEIGAGKRGAYPFTEKEKKQLLEHLQLVEKDITQLRDANLLTESEADLLRKDLPDVVAGVQAKRSKGMEMATCYEPMAMVPPAQASAQRLRDRLPLLQELAGGETLHPAVVRKVLGTVEGDVAVLGNETQIAKLPEDQREKAREVYRSALREVRTIKSKIGEQTPATAPSGAELVK